MRKVTVKPCFNPLFQNIKQTYKYMKKKHIKPIDFRIEKAYKNSVFR